MIYVRRAIADRLGLGLLSALDRRCRSAGPARLSGDGTIESNRSSTKPNAAMSSCSIHRSLACLGDDRVSKLLHNQIVSRMEIGVP
jgi:hypothetical protein